MKDLRKKVVKNEFEELACQIKLWGQETDFVVYLDEEDGCGKDIYFELIEERLEFVEGNKGMLIEAMLDAVFEERVDKTKTRDDFKKDLSIMGAFVEAGFEDYLDISFTLPPEYYGEETYIDVCVNEDNEIESISVES
ncbi:MAG: hypothetical protein FWD89_00415 [Firmicutes bacterium]|nr:hypothetical protein [Bacillota bacterium]MCL2770762.1 hypothetical protein [Bacillota bacterium]